MFKNVLKNSVILTRGERNGIIVLLILLFILIILSFLMPLITKIAEDKELENFERGKKEYLAMFQVPDSTNNDYFHEREFKQHASRHITGSHRKIVNVEINAADTGELMKLPGIGTVFSKRIIKYRQLLGGFYSKQQLSEVYGVTEELLKKNSHCIHIDTSLIRKLNINTDDFKVINAHPYITYEQTKAIFNLRRKTKGKIEKDILKESGIFDVSTLQKIEHYLEFN